MFLYTCLSTITSIISKRIQKYSDDKNLMPKERKGCSRDLKGCKDQLLTSNTILQEGKSRKNNVCIAWIDYQKAFDIVSESWIIKSLELIGINNKTISFTKKTTIYGKTNMRLHTEGKPIEHKKHK
jgi:hypothetical protein